MITLTTIARSLSALLILAASPIAFSGTTERVSVPNGPGEADDYCGSSSISANGRFVVFESNASNLVPGDTNGTTDVFVHDRKKGNTSRVSVDSDGIQANGYSDYASISANGRYVAFESMASDLVPDDTNAALDIFLHDRKKGKTTRISVDSNGAQANDRSFGYTNMLSANGRYIAFESSATNLVPGDTNGTSDIFLHDRKKGQTTRISVDSDGIQANSYCDDPSISANGRYVAFASPASNLVPGDSNGESDVFVRDRKKGKTTRVSIDSNGAQANGYSYDPSISTNGRYVAFASTATNLVPGDSNGEIDVFLHDRKTGVTTRISVIIEGIGGNGGGRDPSISVDGRYVAFASTATNFVASDTNGESDVFVRDLKKGKTTRVSTDSNGAQANDRSHDPSISKDGRYVVFASTATNLVPGDSNGEMDVFVHDRKK